jgi:hypothetical protein
MVHITIDTEKDSLNTLHHIIALLQEETKRRMENNSTESKQEEYENETYSTKHNQEINNNQTTNPFDMFGSGLPTSAGIQPKQKLNVPVGSAINNVSEEKTETNDLFGAFDNETKEKTRSENTNIILDAPPRKEPDNFENSARFAKQVSAQDLINDEAPRKTNSFFKELDEY